jgi:hypothetical protein
MSEKRTEILVTLREGRWVVGTNRSAFQSINRLTASRSHYLFYPEDGDDTFPRNGQFLQDPQGATSQKTAFFIVTVENLESYIFFL